MAKSLSERRLAENEAVFREANNKVQRELKNIADSARTEGHAVLFENEEMPLHFYCECADEKCHERIVIPPAEYQAAHQNSSQFVVLPGHNIPEVERTVEKTSKYFVVEKVMTPPKKADKLNPTDLST